MRYVPVLDECPSINELELALRNFGRGVGEDGFSAYVVKYFQKK